LEDFYHPFVGLRGKAASPAALKLPNRVRTVFSHGIIPVAVYDLWSGTCPCFSSKPTDALKDNLVPIVLDVATS